METVKQLSGRGAGYPLDPSQPGTWDAIETRRYIWGNYNIAAEIVVDETESATNVTYYTWGLDLSGTLQGAGGVGGLLAETKMTGKEGTIIFNDVDLNRVYGQITYDKDTSNFKTGWWLNGAHKVIANGEARCVKRSGGRLSIGSINADLVWHDWIDANPSGENLVKHALET